MAVTIKKRPAKISKFNLKKMIEDCIKTMIVNRLNLRKPQMIRWVEYFPTYTTCTETSEKTISSIYLKVRYEQKFTRLPIEEIEISGASIVEFVDFLQDKGAKEVFNYRELLEQI